MNIDYISLGFVSNDHLAVLPFIPQDTKVKMLSHAILGGGPAGNAAAGYAVLAASAGSAAAGPRVAFLGTIGDDADGKMILEEFAREGVETRFMKTRRGASSAIAYLWIDQPTGARSCVWTREGLDELTAEEIEGNSEIVSLIEHAKILHLDGHNAAGAIAAAKIAKKAGVTIMYDAGTIRDGMEELLPLADLLICSGEFAVSVAAGKTALVKEPYTRSEVEAAVRELYAKYEPKVCGATMGVNGSVAYDGENMVSCPAFHVQQVIDTTGCGDLYHVGFALRYSELCDARRETRDAGDVAQFSIFNSSFSILLACQRFGAAVSALKCRGVSGRPPACPTRAEVEAFLAANS